MTAKSNQNQTIESGFPSSDTRQGIELNGNDYARLLQTKILDMDHKCPSLFTFSFNYSSDQIFKIALGTLRPILYVRQF